MTTTPETTSRRVRVGYLVSGLVCLGLAGSWALWAAGLVGGLSLSRLLPAVLLVAGLAGLVAMVVGGRRSASAAAPPGPAAPYPSVEQHPSDQAEPIDVTDQTRPYPTQKS